MFNNNIKYYIILTIHLIICFFLVYGWIFTNKLWLEFLIMASIYIQVMFGIFGGCICTRLERKYDKIKKSKNTIIDPFLNFLNLRKTRANMDYITGLFVNSGLLFTFIQRYIIMN